MAEITVLEKVFQSTANGVNGDCPLPEPSRGAPTILGDTDLISIRKQPENGTITGQFDYDEEENNQEQKNFILTLKRMVKDKEITAEEAESALKAS